MKSKEEIEQLANEWTNGIDESYKVLLKAVYIKAYTQCQEDMADKMRDLLAWYMVNKGEQYRNETLFVDVVKDYMNSLNKQD
jgi:hypothetical protein